MCFVLRDANAVSVRMGAFGAQEVKDVWCGEIVGG